MSKGTIDTLAENVDMELNQGKTPKETSCPYDKPETTTASPNIVLDEIQSRIPDIMKDSNSEKMVDIPKM